MEPRDFNGLKPYPAPMSGKAWLASVFSPAAGGGVESLGPPIANADSQQCRGGMGAIILRKPRPAIGSSEDKLTPTRGPSLRGVDMRSRVIWAS